MKIEERIKQLKKEIKKEEELYDDCCRNDKFLEIIHRNNIFVKEAKLSGYWLCLDDLNYERGKL